MTPGAVPPLARTPEEWAQALAPLGVRAFHARQVFRWVQARSVVDPEEMTDLPKDLRAKLALLALPETLRVVDERRAADGTRKLLVGLRDGATVETVLIPGVTGPKGRLPSPLLDDADAAAAVDDEEEATIDDESGAAPLCASASASRRRSAARWAACSAPAAWPG